MKLMGVHHVSINIDDVDAALAFYVDTLGLEARTDRPDVGFPGAWLNAGNQQVHLIGASVPKDQGRPFGLAVTDFDPPLGAPREGGVEVSDSVAVGTGRQAFLHDPSGN